MQRLKTLLLRIVTAQPFLVEVGMTVTAFALAVLFILPGSTSDFYGYPAEDVLISALFLGLTVVHMAVLLTGDKGLRTAVATMEVAIFSFITYSSYQTIPNGFGAIFAIPTIGALYVLVRLGDKNAV